MTEEQQVLKQEYGRRESDAMFKFQLKKAAEAGLLLFVKWGLVLILVIFAFNYFTRVNQAALTGEQAAIAVRMFQEKGWLPQFTPDGKIPDKQVKEENEKTTP